MKNPKGVHIESLLCALGALAGYACQATLRAQALAKGLSETAPFHIASAKDGKQYFFGDQLNDVLVGAKYSVWHLAGGAAQDVGIQEFPDINEMFQHTATVLGTNQFGIPRVPDDHKAGTVPADYLKEIWPAFFLTVKRFCPDPAHWPILYSLAIREAIHGSKGVIDPTLALRIVMESAIPMSKVDLTKL